MYSVSILLEVTRHKETDSIRWVLYILVVSFVAPRLSLLLLILIILLSHIQPLFTTSVFVRLHVYRLFVSCLIVSNACLAAEDRIVKCGTGGNGSAVMLVTDGRSRFGSCPTESTQQGQ